MATARGAVAGALPSDDVLRDIFSRLPDPLDLLRCAGTCRQWLRLLGDPAFLPRWANGRRASFILGAFSQSAHLVRPTEPTKRKQSLWPPQFERLQTPLLDRLRPSDLSLFFPNDGGLFDYANPLSSRRGLLLLRIKPAPFDPRKLHLAVCHPIIGERSMRIVPPPPLNVDPWSRMDTVIGHALVTATDHRTTCDLDDHCRHPAFQVLLTAMDSNKQLRAYSYTSATGRWSAPIDCPHVSGLTMSGPRAGTVAEGTVHWLYRDATIYYTLGVGIDSEHAVSSLTAIPIHVGHDPRRLRPPFPCTVRGKLALVNKSDTGKLDLWMKPEQSDDRRGCSNGAGGWLCSELIYKQAAKNITMFAFLESKGAMLIRIDDELFTLDLVSKELDQMRGYSRYTGKLCGQVECRGRNSCGDCTYNKRVIYEMDWPAYLIHLYGPKEVVKQGETDACRV